MILPRHEIPPTPTVFSRVMAVLVGSLYLAYLTALGWTVSELPLWTMALLVAAGAIAIMAVLVVFGMKAYVHRGPARRFGLATIFLVMLPLSIYLAAIRWMLDKAQLDELSGEQWIIVLIFSAAFMLLSTVILLWMAEALMWFATVLQSKVLRRRNP